MGRYFGFLQQSSTLQTTRFFASALRPEHMWFLRLALSRYYTGWPRKNATPTVNNFKKTRDRMKNLCALLHIKFFFQQDDTKIVHFDEGVLILEPFFWVIFKICTFCIKSHVWGREEFLWVAPPDSNAAKLRNECFSLFMLASLYKARADTLPWETKQWKIFGTYIVTFEIEGQILKMTLPQKNGHRIITPSSKLTILVSSYYKKNFIRNNAHKCFILSPVSWNYWSKVLHSFWATLYYAAVSYTWSIFDYVMFIMSWDGAVKFLILYIILHGSFCLSKHCMYLRLQPTNNLYNHRSQHNSM